MPYANREDLNAWRRAKRLSNLDQARSHDKSYRLANPDKFSAYQRKYRQSHPEYTHRQNAVRRSRLLRADIRSVTERDWRRLCNRFHNKCAFCGAQEKLTQEHVIPLSRGGRHSIGNLLPACRSCNSSKLGQYLVEWKGCYAWHF